MDKRIYSKEFLLAMQKQLNSVEKYITYPKFVFLCGKSYKKDFEAYPFTNRGLTDSFLRALSSNVFIVLSEELWEDSFNSSIDLLTFEEFLADVSDCIILFVESEGTYAELGTFAYADKLFSEKLLIVIDEQYRNAKSFIMEGPVAKAKKDKVKIVYASLYKGDLLASDELRQILEDKVNEFLSKNATLNKRKPNDNKDSVQVNVFIVELLELIHMLQPISKKDLLEVYKAIKDFNQFKFVKKDGLEYHDEIRYDYILKLLENVKLITIDDDIILSEYDQINTNLFLKMGIKERNKERNRLLSRKYRYKEIGCGYCKKNL